MQEVILTNDAKAKILHDYLSQTYVPQLSDHLFKTDEYLKKEQEDFEKIINQSDELTEELVEKKTIISRTVKQLIDKIQSEQEKLKKSETYKKGKKDELTAIQKAIDSISSAMKETCSKIDSKELNKIGQLPQGMDQFMSKLFHIIYNEDQSKFNWADFKKKVFDQDKGADFQSRLANFQFKGVSQEKENLLLEMKADPQFQKVFQDPQYTKAFLDIADWIHFAVSGIENQRKKDQSAVEFERIDKEFAGRKVELESYQRTHDFWVSQLKYVEDQQVLLHQLQPNIKQVAQEIQGSKGLLEQHIGKFIQGAEKVNELMHPNI
ncbi:unnamed protein product [Paramecium pentaurelia]|uniref:Uncharacterized protein n=1 Tax=Paramecium pentaurelia TaxID=43138 RepID=A0A8S1S7K1_9CILI|nr:unnamed protein product [Paramecium pentaurelia]